MLNCRDVAHKASDYIDHNLSGWQRFWMRLHLWICTPCQRFVHHVQITRDYIQRKPPLQASPEDVQKVLQRVTHDQDERL